jgi:hypothetical protein
LFASEIEDLDAAGMIEAARGFGFDQKSGFGGGVIGPIRVEHFNGHEAIEDGMAGAVEGSHAATTDKGFQDVLAVG